MRITGGALRGRVVQGRIPAGVRPTGSRVREALFNVLGQDLSGLSVLDVYGGSGLLSFEALSRGAERATLVERRAKTAAFVRRAARDLGLQERLEVRIGAAPGAIGEGSWDLALLDPPYGDPVDAVLAELAGRVRWRLVLEAPRDAEPPEGGGWELVQQRDYGQTSLRFYAPRSD